MNALQQILLKEIGVKNSPGISIVLRIIDNARRTAYPDITCTNQGN